MKQSVSKQTRRCIEQMISNARPRKYKKACRHTVKEPGVFSNEHGRAEAHVNDGIGSLGRAVLEQRRQTTHSSTCGVPDRESNEVNYLREATELTEGWQLQLQGGQAMNGPSPEHSEVILVERQR